MVLVLLPAAFWPFLVLLSSFLGGFYLGLAKPFIDTYSDSVENTNYFTYGIK